MEDKQFESKILFDAKIKYCGLKVNKDGSLMGRITPHLQLLIQENKYSKNDFDKYMAYLVPVKFTKIGDKQEPEVNF